MKIFSGGKSLSPATARNCCLVNQFATPGLGSLMGRRIVAGIGQLLLAFLGAALVIYWVFVKPSRKNSTCPTRKRRFLTRNGSLVRRVVFYRVMVVVATHEP